MEPVENIPVVTSLQVNYYNQSCKEGKFTIFTIIIETASEEARTHSKQQNQVYLAKLSRY